MNDQCGGQRVIAVVAGYWSTNIGNSFFQLGAEYLLKLLFPNDRVLMLSDQPGYWNVAKGNPANALILLEHIHLDYLVILGPFLRPEYDRIWLDTLRNLHRKGVKIVALSVGMMDYSDGAVALYRRWLSEVPLHILTTRDEDTFVNLGDLAEHAYNGVDVALFVSDLFKPPYVDLGEFVIFNFDSVPEPHILMVEHSESVARPGVYHFSMQGKDWKLEFPRIRTALSRRSKVFPFLDSLWPRHYPERMGDSLIVRTDHRFNPMITRKAFKGPNSLVSDIPYSYLTLYANGQATFTNRVHACVAAAAYGRPAMLFSDTPRVRLLSRIGLGTITEGLQCADQVLLAREKNQLLGFLKTIIGQPHGTPMSGLICDAPERGLS